MLIRKSQQVWFQEGVLVACFVCGISALAIYFDAFDAWYRFTQQHENWELDELSIILFAFFFACSVLSIRYNVTLKRLSQEIKDANDIKFRHEKMAALGQVASGMAHEINNALQPTIGLSGFIRKHLEETRRHKELGYLDTMVQSTYHAQDIINNVLEFSSQQALELSEYNPTALFNEILSFHRSLLPSTIEFIPENLDKYKNLFSFEQYIKANKTATSQIILNLLKNASDAMHGKGKIHLALNVETSPNYRKTYVVFSIRDEGVGIPAEVMEHIFEPFFTTKDPSEGTGLGLPTVLNIAQHMDADISITSHEGSGTTCRLKFPLHTKPVEIL